MLSSPWIIESDMDFYEDLSVNHIDMLSSPWIIESDMDFYEDLSVLTDLVFSENPKPKEGSIIDCNELKQSNLVAFDITSQPANQKWKMFVSYHLTFPRVDRLCGKTGSYVCP